MPDLIHRGDVWLVGAGPGDPELLTRKAEALIKAATVVFHDALVGPGILSLIPPHVGRVAVGKRAGKHSQHQDTINALLVEAALAGERVVRLKGGDPSMFGRSGEEIDALAAHGIRARVCPGITAASAAVANAGGSLSLRGAARRVEFITAQSCTSDDGLDWRALADRRATLAIYMGKRAAPRISRQLMANGLGGDTPVLIAVDVSLPSERLVHTRLDLLALAVDADTGTGPALIVVGEVARSRPAQVGHTAPMTVVANG